MGSHFTTNRDYEENIEGAGEVTVIVDNSISRGNVRRMEENHGCEVNIEEKEDRIYLHLTKGQRPMLPMQLHLQSIPPCW